MGNPWILVEESSDSDGIFHGADSGIPKKKDLNCDVTGMIIHKDNHPQMAASLTVIFRSVFIMLVQPVVYNVARMDQWRQSSSGVKISWSFALYLFGHRCLADDVQEVPHIVSICGNMATIQSIYYS